MNKVLVRHNTLALGGKKITYCWVPGHEGIRGNDLADVAAKDATNQVAIDMPLPSNDLKRKIKKYIEQKWQVAWDSERDNKLYEIQPKIGIAKKGRCKSRREEIVMNSLRTGHSRLTHSYLMKREPRPLCNRCQKHLTVKHFLVKCRQCPIRAQYHQCTTLKELFDTCKPETILDYVKNLGYYSQI